jgi:hypothetical protein
MAKSPRSCATCGGTTWHPSGLCEQCRPKASA